MVGMRRNAARVEYKDPVAGCVTVLLLLVVTFPKWICGTFCVTGQGGKRLYLHKNTKNRNCCIIFFVYKPKAETRKIPEKDLFQKLFQKLGYFLLHCQGLIYSYK